MLELPDFAQDVAAKMEAEAAAESGDEGKPSQKAMMFGDGMSQRDGFVATMSH